MNTLRNSAKMTTSVMRRYNFLDFPDQARSTKEIPIVLLDKINYIGKHC